MTKSAYYEMCEALGTEPIEEEIPVEIEDFPDVAQQCFTIYYILTDVWDTMGGNYLGKDYSIVFDLFDMYSVDDKLDRLLYLDLLQQIDRCRSKTVNEKIKQKANEKPAK